MGTIEIFALLIFTTNEGTLRANAFAILFVLVALLCAAGQVENEQLKKPRNWSKLFSAMTRKKRHLRQWLCQLLQSQFQNTHIASGLLHGSSIPAAKVGLCVDPILVSTDPKEKYSFFDNRMSVYLGVYQCI